MSVQLTPLLFVNYLEFFFFLQFFSALTFYPAESVAILMWLIDFNGMSTCLGIFYA